MRLCIPISNIHIARSPPDYKRQPTYQYIVSPPSQHSCPTIQWYRTARVPWFSFDQATLSFGDLALASCRSQQALSQIWAALSPHADQRHYGWENNICMSWQISSHHYRTGTVEQLSVAGYTNLIHHGGQNDSPQTGGAWRGRRRQNCSHNPGN